MAWSTGWIQWLDSILEAFEALKRDLLPFPTVPNNLEGSTHEEEVPKYNGRKGNVHVQSMKWEFSIYSTLFLSRINVDVHRRIIFIVKDHRQRSSSRIMASFVPYVCERWTRSIFLYSHFFQYFQYLECFQCFESLNPNTISKLKNALQGGFEWKISIFIVFRII